MFATTVIDTQGDVYNECRIFAEAQSGPVTESGFRSVKRNEDLGRSLLGQLLRPCLSPDIRVHEKVPIGSGQKADILLCHRSSEQANYFPFVLFECCMGSKSEKVPQSKAYLAHLEKMVKQGLKYLVLVIVWNVDHSGSFRVMACIRHDGTNPDDNVYLQSPSEPSRTSQDGLQSSVASGPASGTVHGQSASRSSQPERKIQSNLSDTSKNPLGHCRFQLVTLLHSVGITADNCYRLMRMVNWHGGNTISMND